VRPPIRSLHAHARRARSDLIWNGIDESIPPVVSYKFTVPPAAKAPGYTAGLFGNTTSFVDGAPADSARALRIGEAPAGGLPPKKATTFAGDALALLPTGARPQTCARGQGSGAACVPRGAHAPRSAWCGTAGAHAQAVQLRVARPGQVSNPATRVPPLTGCHACINGWCYAPGGKCDCYKDFDGDACERIRELVPRARACRRLEQRCHPPVGIVGQAGAVRP
jgi:hypothetical protein